MGISKVNFGGDTLIDLTNDSVDAASLLKGKTAHNAAGEQIVGEADVIAMGLSGLDVGDQIMVSTVDADGKPTSWKKSGLICSTSVIWVLKAMGQPTILLLFKPLCRIIAVCLCLAAYTCYPVKLPLAMLASWN